MIEFILRIFILFILFMSKMSLLLFLNLIKDFLGLFCLSKRFKSLLMRILGGGWGMLKIFYFVLFVLDN